MDIRYLFGHFIGFCWCCKGNKGQKKNTHFCHQVFVCRSRDLKEPPHPLFNTFLLDQTWLPCKLRSDLLLRFVNFQEPTLTSLTENICLTFGLVSFLVSKPEKLVSWCRQKFSANVSIEHKIFKFKVKCYLLKFILSINCELISLLSKSLY